MHKGSGAPASLHHLGRAKRARHSKFINLLNLVNFSANRKNGGCGEEAQVGGATIHKMGVVADILPIKTYLLIPRFHSHLNNCGGMRIKGRGGVLPRDEERVQGIRLFLERGR